MNFATVAPFINKVFYVTGKYGEVRPDHTHVGLDIATTTNDNLYSLFDGVVIDKGDDLVRGHYIVVKGTNNLAFLYQHMMEASPFVIGQSVMENELIGIEGSTGESTGIHLHVEMQDLSNRDWNWSNDISYYLNPADYMGIPNETGAECYYSGAPYITSLHKKGFKFVLFKKRQSFE